MVGSSRLFGAGSLFAVGAATLVAALALREARKSVEVAGDRVGRLREEQARLLASLSEERRTFETGLRRERELRLEAQNLVRQEREGREQERRARRDAEQRIDRLEKEIWELREAHERRNDRLEERIRELREAQRDREARKERATPVAAVPSGGPPETPVGSKTQPPPQPSPPALASPARRVGGVPRSAGQPETAPPQEPARVASRAPRDPEDAGPRRRAVWHPHPDDGPDRKGVPASRRANARGDARVEMFRRYYDRYLENYRGYVELVKGLHRARDAGEVPPGSPAEREWEERLRRANDGVERTSAKLDILEQHNPDLAADERINRRAGFARRYSELAPSEQGRGGS